MKKTKLAAVLLSVFIAGGISFADVNFSGMAGGTAGVNGTISDSPSFEVPFNAFIAAQMNFGSWGIFRANLGLATKNLAGGNLFTGQDATLTMNELSFVFTKSGVKIKNYFSAYLGTYEAVGCDEYLQRQFGIVPYTSLATKNASTLSTGIPLYNNYGTGVAYTMNFAEAPGTFGATVYVNETETKIPKLNIDLRTAWTTEFLTLDFAAGIGAPLQNSYAGKNVFLLIDTIYLHGGLSLLLGSRYTHSFLLQGGVQKVEIAKGSLNYSFSGTDDLSLLAEARIYSKLIKTRITAYNLPKSILKNMLYLQDPLGVVISLYSDTVPVKNNNMTIGAHLIGTLPNEDFTTVISRSAFKDAVPSINVYLTPFVDLPVAGGNLEIMAQIGAIDLINKLHFNYQAKVGYKKAF